MYWTSRPPWSLWPSEPSDSPEPPQGHQGQKATRAFWADWAEWDDWVAVLTLRDIIADKNAESSNFYHLISDNELLKRDLCQIYLKYETCI